MRMRKRARKMVIPMNISIDIAYKSLNKLNEELCGDKVEILHTKDSHILILADGMGSGVKANILATLTSKILGTMFLNGASLEACVETIAKTLPICQERLVAYATFSILQVFDNGSAYLVEYDNPSCIFIRDGKLVPIPRHTREIEGKSINEYRFQVQEGDTFVLTSDGTIYAGVGKLLNLGWTWDNMSAYAVQAAHTTKSAARLAAVLSKACDDLYEGRPGDDTTVAVMRITRQRLVKLMTGPPKKPEDDEKAVRQLMDGDAYRIVSGGTSANIVSRILGKKITDVSEQTPAPDIPPIARIEGIDLTTEGVLTLSHAIDLLKRYANNEDDDAFYNDLDQKNGSAMIASVLIEDCTDLEIILGTAVNAAHQNPSLSFSLHARNQLAGQLKQLMEQMGKRVTVTYY